jgi:hypothetical protein
MPIQGRDQLKKYFRNGNLAREEYFIDLIDSSVNHVSDQFTMSDQSGVNVVASSTGRKFFSLFKNKKAAQDQTASFAIQYREDASSNESISVTAPLANNAVQSLLFIKKESSSKGGFVGKIGINTAQPQAELEVNGAVAMRARIGTFRDSAIDYTAIKADGKWHVLVSNLSGLSAFELVAGINNKGSYAMKYCVAMNIPGRKGSIKPIQQIYSSWFYRIQLRWVKGDNGSYSLQIRTAWAYKTAPQIQVRITRLWS